MVPGTQIGGLGLEMTTRRRNRVNGVLLPVASAPFPPSASASVTGVVGAGGGGAAPPPPPLLMRVDVSFGNCPKYIQGGPAGGRAGVWDALSANPLPSSAPSLLVANSQRNSPSLSTPFRPLPPPRRGLLHLLLLPCPRMHVVPRLYHITDVPLHPRPRSPPPPPPFPRPPPPVRNLDIDFGALASHVPGPVARGSGEQLAAQQLALIAASDTFFIATAYNPKPGAAHRPTDLPVRPEGGWGGRQGGGVCVLWAQGGRGGQGATQAPTADPPGLE